MRLAGSAALAAAVVAAPFLVGLFRPSMTPSAFVAAVGCAAYADASGAPVGAQKLRLNAEARRQPAAAVEEARVQAIVMTRNAASVAPATDAAMLASCTGVHVAGAGGTLGARLLR